MQRTIINILFILIGINSVKAQNEMANKTLQSADRVTSGLNIPDGQPLSEIKEYDGILLDMGLLNLTAPRKLQRFTLEVPDVSKDYSYIFRLNPNEVYSRGNYNLYGFSPTAGYWSTSSNLLMGSFTLKNGMKMNTYGEYDKDGNKVFNPSALPWQRNNFKGAFELKSSDGTFGVRFEVQRGRESPF